MNPQQAENLRILIRHMETLKVPELGMIRERNLCGTPSCAMGHARTVGALGIPSSIDLFSAAINYFGLDPETRILNRNSWCRLFGASLVVWGNDDVPRSSFTPPPKTWAVEARKVLAENGYSMDDKADAFIANIKALPALSFPEATRELQQRYLGEVK
ncbi:MAG TPA: hypothetical protein VHV32_19035 [Candidatus Angelobacter sp.]|jgi:hypothetical protein|nr:hypothetical protein [Candidatus Angelobacter sp.]